VLGEPRTVRELGSAVDARLEVQARRSRIKVKFFSSMAAWLVYLSRTCRQDAFWTFSGDSGSPRGRGRRKIPTLLFAGL